MGAGAGQGAAYLQRQRHMPTCRLVSLQLRREGCLSSAEDYRDGLR